MLTFLYQLLLEPRATKEATRRKEIILNVLLVASLLLAIVAFVFDLLERLRHPFDYDGSQQFIVPGILLFFGSLLLLSRRQQIAIPSFMLVLLYYAAATFCVYRWGITVPIGLLIYTLVISLSGILGTASTAITATLVIIATLSALYQLRLIGLIHPNLIWQTKQAEFVDLPVICFIFLILFFVSWLSRREIEYSLARALASEEALQAERDTLEITVQTRTAELRRSQKAETLQLYELVEVGRLSSTLLHDVLNPLTTISLTLERLRESQVSDLLERAIRNTRKIEQIVTMARKHIRSDRHIVRFSPSNEITDVLEIFSDRLQHSNIVYVITANQSNILVGDPIRFHRLISNLLANAIDAYDALPAETERKPLQISLSQLRPKQLELSITDYGCGISSALAERIFTPFFTTKNNSVGSGIGLSICQEIVEYDFFGSISITSKPDLGTVVSVLLNDQDECY